MGGDLGRRTWIKIFCDNWLRGTIREETLELRGAWVDLLALAGDSAYGDIGKISLVDKCGLSDEQICMILNVEKQVWKRIKNRLIKTDRIRVNGYNEIEIINWEKYQSEYHRQLPYRKDSNLKLQPKVTTKVTGRTEGEQKEKENKDNNIYIVILDFWNSQEIIQHRKVTDKMKRSINGRLNEGYKENEIKQSIENYNKILKGVEYYFSHKWTLIDFLQRGFEKFKDWEIADYNYRTDKQKTEEKEHKKEWGKITDNEGKVIKRVKI